MSNLFGTMSISLSGLMAQQAALQVTSENISNVNTPGYARRRPVMVEQTPTAQGLLSPGNGVRVDKIESLRDSVLDLRIAEETEARGQLDGFLCSMQEIDAEFSGIDRGIGADLDSLFNAVTRLSTDPTSIPLRQNVLIAAGNLASSFVASAQKLRSVQQDIDRGLVQRVSQVNELSRQIATLNAQISQARNMGGQSAAFEDQRSAAIRHLSSLIGISTVDGDDGLVVTTASGAPLVVGNESFSLDIEPDGSGYQHVYADEADITSRIAGGEIAGLVRARDAGIADALNRLNTLASAIATAFNAAHNKGFDLNGEPGGLFFATPAATDAAANMRLEISDPAKLAASTDGSKGDNGNLPNLVAIRTAALVGGATPASFYAGLVARIGSQVASAKSEYESSDLVILQLENQRAAISGVSLDEEAANLVRYQRGFEAAARVISVVNDLMQTVLQLGRN